MLENIRMQDETRMFPDRCYSGGILLQQIKRHSRISSFIRKATLPTIAGNPPADAAHPSGIKGMILTVHRKVTTEPRAPSTPSFLFQNPANNVLRTAIPKRPGNSWRL